MVRRFRRRGNARRARSFVRRTVVNMGTIHAKRVLCEGLTVPDISATAYDNALSIPLLTCLEAQDEELESDGTNIATAPLYSKLVGMKMDIKVRGTVNDSNVIRWVLFKSPDNDITAQSMMDNFHNSDESTTARERRQNMLSKGYFLLNKSSGVSNLRIFVRKQTLRRLGKLKENDRIYLAMAMNAAATTNPLVYIMGTLYVKTAP